MDSPSLQPWGLSLTGALSGNFPYEAKERGNVCTLAIRVSEYFYSILAKFPGKLRYKIEFVDLNTSKNLEHDRTNRHGVLF